MKMDMRCVYCGSERVVKSGKTSTQKQRYLCRACGRRFIVSYKKKRYPNDLQRIARRLSKEGVKISAIARALEVPYTTAYEWTKR